MMKKIQKVAAVACVALAAMLWSAPKEAAAQTECDYGYAGYGGLYGIGFGGYGQFGGFGRPYAAGRIKTPPYFALHPPVYYNAPVPRSYGYSPFAYRGNVRTPQVVEQVVPQVMLNPFVKPDSQPVKAEAAAPDNDMAQALMIYNPFVSDEADTVVELARRE